MSFSFLFGQKAARENVLVEIATGTWCTYCPGAAMGADDLISNGHDVAVIENHNGDPFANAYSNARNSYYGISGYPTAKFDGILTEVGGSHTTSMYSTYLPRVNQRLAVSSNFHMTMEGSSGDMQNCELILDVEKLSGSYGDLRLHVAITQSHIPYSWQGQNMLNFVNRLMVPNQNGTTLNFSSQNNHQVTLNFTMNGSWVWENCEVVAFLQNYSTKEVYQTVKLRTVDFNIGMFAGFTADNQIISVGEGITFTDISGGNPSSWYWEFEGGTPSSYTGQYPPTIIYNTTGLFDVSLTVSDGVDSDTEIKSDYISVTNHCPASGGANYLYISNITIGSINNSSQQTEYGNYTELSTDLYQGDEDVEVVLTNPLGYELDDIGIWIDWNQDGDFDDINENVVCEIDLTWSGFSVYSSYFNVPYDANPGLTTIRIRLKHNGSDCGDPCGSTTYGEVEDYSLNIIETSFEPVADFMADDITPDLGQTVYFTDLSTNSPDSWTWGFNPSTVSYLNGTNANSQFTEVSFNAPGYYTVTLTASNASGSDQEIKLNYIYVENPIIHIDASCYLEGFYNGFGMSTNLNSMLPLDQPYNQTPWNYNGQETVSSMQPYIVDWVLVELRDAVSASLATPSTSLGMQAALIRNNGQIVALDGVSDLEFEVSYLNNLYLVVHHRNHLAIISSQGIESVGGVYSYDFSIDAAQCLGGVDAQNQIGNGVWGLISGDANADGTVDLIDINTVWNVTAGFHGYHQSDQNGNGEVDNIDKNDFNVSNLTKSSWLPQ
jgi:PKD repeat protein